MPSNAIIRRDFQTVHASPSTVRSWLERVGGGSGTAHQVHHAAHTLRQLEVPLVGAALGAVHAELVNGLDFHKVPIDAAVGVVGLILGIANAGGDLSHEFTNAGTAGLTVFAFRKTNAFLAAKKGDMSKRGVKARIRGDFEGDEDIGVDPVIEAASKL